MKRSGLFFLSTVTTHCLILLAVALGGLTLILTGSCRMPAAIAPATEFGLDLVETFSVSIESPMGAEG